jgi:putative transcriptional regulator
MARESGSRASARAVSAGDDAVLAGEAPGPGGIRIRLDEVLSATGMTLTELSDRVGITVVNLSVLKNGRARAIRFSTLAGLCAVLGCQPGDLLSYDPASDDPASYGSGSESR